MTYIQKMQFKFMVLVVRLLYDIAHGYTYVKPEDISLFRADCEAYVENQP